MSPRKFSAELADFAARENIGPRTASRSEDREWAKQRRRALPVLRNEPEVEDPSLFEGIEKGTREIIIELRNLGCLVAKCHRGGQGHVCGHYVSFAGPPSEEPDQPVVAFLAGEMDRMRSFDCPERAVGNSSIEVDGAVDDEISHGASPSVSASSSGAGVGTPTVGAEKGGALDSPADAPPAHTDPPRLHSFALTGDPRVEGMYMIRCVTCDSPPSHVGPYTFAQYISDH